MGRATLKLDHCLIDGHFAVRMVGVCEAAGEVLDQGPHLPKPVMPIHTARNQGLVVGEVEETEEVPEPLAADAVCDGGVVQERVLLPIVLHFWKMIDPHQQAKADEGFQFLRRNWLPPFERFLTEDLLCIQIALAHNPLQQIVREKKLKYTQWSGRHRYHWPDR